MSTSDDEPTSGPGAHPWVLALAMATLAWSAAFEQVPWPSFPPALVSILLFATVCYGVARLVAREHHKAAVLATIVVWWAFAPMFVGSRVVLGILTVAAIGVIVAVVRAAGPFVGISRMLDLGAVAMLVVPLFELCVEAVDHDHPGVAETLPPVPPIHPPEVQPDVYLIVLDGYGRADVLASLYGYDNQLFLAHLRGQGFAISDGARSNYGQTGLSITSMLEAHYVDDVLVRLGPQSIDRRPLLHLLDHALVPETFRAAGYDISTVRGPFSMTDLRGADHVLQPSVRLDDFDYNLLGLTMVPVILRQVGYPPGGLRHRLWARHLQWSLQMLPHAVPDDAPPTFVFAHVVCPHPPFVFDRDGNYRDPGRPFMLQDGAVWTAWAADDDVPYAEQYVDQLIYLNREITLAVDAIIARDRPAVIVLTGDHGPGAGYDPGEPEPSPAALWERYSILLAVRGADPATTPINAVRSAMRAAIGAELPPEPDETYHSTYGDPYVFKAVPPEVMDARRTAPALVEPPP